MTIESRLLEVLKTVTGTEQVEQDLDLPLFDAHLLDSMRTVELIVAISREFAIDISLAEFERDDWATPRLIIADVESRVKAQAEYLEKRAQASSDDPFALNTRGTHPPFFCLPGLLNLARHLDRAQPFYGLSFPPTEVLAKEETTIEQIAADYIRQIRAVQPTGPYFLGGYSYGGVVIFEVARQFEEQGEKVGMLAMFDPDPPSPYPSGFSTHHIRRYLHHFRRLSKLGPGAQLRYLLHGFRNKAVKLFPQLLRQNEAEAKMDVFTRLSEAIHSRYEAQNYAGSATIFLAQDTQWRQTPEQDPRMEWCKFIAGRTEIVAIPGDHELLYREPYVCALAEKLDLSLQKARTKPTPKISKATGADITVLFAILTAFWI